MKDVTDLSSCIDGGWVPWRLRAFCSLQPYVRVCTCVHKGAELKHFFCHWYVPEIAVTCRVVWQLPLPYMHSILHLTLHSISGRVGAEYVLRGYWWPELLRILESVALGYRYKLDFHYSAILSGSCRTDPLSTSAALMAELTCRWHL